MSNCRSSRICHFHKLTERTVKKTFSVFATATARARARPIGSLVGVVTKLVERWNSGHDMVRKDLSGEGTRNAQTVSTSEARSESPSHLNRRRALTHCAGMTHVNMFPWAPRAEIMDDSGPASEEAIAQFMSDNPEWVRSHDNSTFGVRPRRTQNVSFKII